jgi:hypothetical protein
MIVEDVDRRILGAFRCIDAVSNTPVLDAVTVQSDQLDVRRNASQIWVVFDAPGLHELTTEFDVKSPWPAPLPFNVSIRSISRRYLPRKATIKVPRKLAPMGDPSSVMVLQDVVMYPSPTATTLPNWALVRASVTKNNTNEGLPWAVVRITRNTDQTVLATGIANEHGDALLAVPRLGISVNQNGGGAVTEPTFDVTITALWDPGNQGKPASFVADPDVILLDLNNTKWKKFSLAQPVKIGRGTLSNVKLPIAV